MLQWTIECYTKLMSGLSIREIEFHQVEYDNKYSKIKSVGIERCPTQFFKHN